MEIDQWIFRKLYSPIKSLLEKKESPEVIERTVHLEGIKQRLSILSCLLTGDSIKIQTAEKEGGYRGDVFYLPAKYNHAKTILENIEYYIFRVLYLSTQRKLGFNWTEQKSYPREISLKKAAETFPFVLEAMEKEYPFSKNLIVTVCKNETECQEKSASQNLSNGQGYLLSYLHGIWMTPEIANRSGRLEPNQQDKTIQSPTTEKEGKAKEEVIILEKDKKKIEEYTLNHNFEKIDTVEEFQGDWRDLDGSDELEEHEEAVNELDLRHLIRTDDPSQSMYRSDVLRPDIPIEAVEIVNAIEKFQYDEWDYKKNSYKKKYCSVYTDVHKTKDLEYYKNCIQNHSKTLLLLKEKINRLANQLEQVRKQDFGEDVDMDAALDHAVQLFSKTTPEEKLYVSKRKKKREMSLLILIDLSLSTDGYVSNNRILDVEKESLILLGEICAEFGDRFQIDCFSSKTRNDCEYLTVKSFSETWQDKKNYIGSLTPRGYTRIGPAIRHAKFLLDKEISRKKWILLLSDGKPNDYDRYEGKYGIEDVRKAVHECDRSNISLFALAIEKSAKDYLPPMLGEGRFRILQHPNKLPEAMAEIYSKVFR